MSVIGAPNNDGGVRKANPPKTSSLIPGGQNLTSPILARLEVDVVRTAQFTALFVLDVSRLLKGVSGTAEAALH